MFLEFVNRKKSKKFNNDLIKATEGRADLMQIGAKNTSQIFKVVINPKAERTVCFISDGDSSLGMLSYLESDFYVPNNKRVIFVSLINEKGDSDINRNLLELNGEYKIIWNALKNENINLVHTFHENLNTFYLHYTHHKELAEDLRELSKKYFNIFLKDEKCPLDKVRGTIEDKFLIERAIPYVTTENPGKANIEKRTQFNKNAIKMTINSF